MNNPTNSGNTNHYDILEAAAPPLGATAGGIWGYFVGTVDKAMSSLVWGTAGAFFGLSAALARVANEAHRHDHDWTGYTFRALSIGSAAVGGVVLQAEIIASPHYTVEQKVGIVATTAALTSGFSAVLQTGAFAAEQSSHQAVVPQP